MGAFVAHHDNVGLSVAVDVGDEDIMGARRGGIENDSFKLVGAGVTGVAIPNAAADQVERAVVIEIKCGEADVGKVVGADEVPDPMVRCLEFEPEKLGGLEGTAAANEVEVAIVIEINQGGEAIVTDAFGCNREIAIDVMVFELKIGRINRKHEGDCAENWQENFRHEEQDAVGR